MWQGRKVNLHEVKNTRRNPLLPYPCVSRIFERSQYSTKSIEIRMCVSRYHSNPVPIGVSRIRSPIDIAVYDTSRLFVRVIGTREYSSLSSSEIDTTILIGSTSILPEILIPARERSSTEDHIESGSIDKRPSPYDPMNPSILRVADSEEYRDLTIGIDRTDSTEI
jgi:hypothetical protein